MKSETNRALWAKKKIYEIPSVEMAIVNPCTIICVSNLTVNGSEPIPDNEGGD